MIPAHLVVVCSSTAATTAATDIEISNTLTDGTFEVSGSSTEAPETTAATTTATTTTTTSTTSTVPEFTSGDETVQLTIYTSNLSSGRHTLYIQATDSDGYTGPVASTFIEVSRRQLRGGGSFS